MIKLSSHQKKIIKDNPDLDLGYLGYCSKQYLDNLHKIQSPYLNYASIVNF